MLAIAAGVKLSSPGPVLFRQRRYGLSGKVVQVWKFRSMSAEEDVGHSHPATEKNGVGPDSHPAASSAVPRDDIAFVLVGAGAEEKNLREKAARRGLSNVHFAGSVSKAEVREVWRLCDVDVLIIGDVSFSEWRSSRRS